MQAETTRSPGENCPLLRSSTPLSISITTKFTARLLLSLHSSHLQILFSDPECCWSPTRTRIATVIEPSVGDSLHTRDRLCKTSRDLSDALKSATASHPRSSLPLTYSPRLNLQWVLPSFCLCCNRPPIVSSSCNGVSRMYDLMHDVSSAWNTLLSPTCLSLGKHMVSAQGSSPPETPPSCLSLSPPNTR